jgi:hypothetical protein
MFIVIAISPLVLFLKPAKQPPGQTPVMAD